MPVYNEQNAVERFVDEVDRTLSPLASAIQYEIIFVNDGSTDATELAIRGLEDAPERIRLINLSRNFGKDAALAAGLHAASGDAVIPIDVDLQDPPELIPQMIDLWQKGADIVHARRTDRSHDSWLKRATAAGFYRIFNALAEHPIPADVGDFRLLDRKVVEVIRGFGERARFNKGLFSWVGFNAAEVTYERPPRAGGSSAWTYWRLWNFALDGIFSSSTMPLRIWTYVGLGMSVASFLYAAFILVFTLVVGRETPGYASTVILILIFGGLNMIALGIIGEYVGRIYAEVRRRPLYVVRSTYGFDESE